MRLTQALALLALSHRTLATQDTRLRATDPSARTIPWALQNNPNLVYNLQLSVTVNNIRLGAVDVDTGSTGFLIAENFLNTPADVWNNSLCAFEYLSSSGIFYEGRWVHSTVSFDGTDIEASVPVLAVTNIGTCENYTNNTCSGKTYSNKTITTQYMGIGFGRWSPQQPDATPEKNVMLNIQGLESSLRQGYIIDTQGITVGVSDEDVNNGWTNTQLRRNLNSTASDSLPDWEGMPATIKVCSSPYYYEGTALFDTGLDYSFLSVPSSAIAGVEIPCEPPTGKPCSILANNVTITVLLGGPLEAATSTFSITVGESAVPSTPKRVVPVQYNCQAFINTGRYFFNAYSLLLDAENGILGLKSIDGSKSSSSLGYEAEYEL